MENTIKTITRKEVQKLNSNDIYAYILLDGEFIINSPKSEKEGQGTDFRFCYGDFDSFKFEHDLENLKYLVVKDKKNLTGTSFFKVVGKHTS